MDWEQLTDRVGLYQDAAHRINEDPLRLVRFFSVKPSDRILDLGTGNGVLCLYAQALYGGRYTGIDLDETALSLAAASAARNGQEIAFLPMDVCDAPTKFGHGTFDRILTNPPYFTTGDPGERALARHADKQQLSDWCRAAFLLLRNGGTLTLCYPASALAPLFRALDQSRFAPKRMELIASRGTARLVLVEAKKLGGDGLTVTLAE